MTEKPDWNNRIGEIFGEQEKGESTNNAPNRPAWTSRPSPTEGAAAFELLRIGSKPAKDLVVLSTEITGVNVHFWGGRTVPCTGRDCKACLESGEPRWRGYIWVANVYSGVAYCLELTAASAQPLIKRLDDSQRIQGAVVQLWRRGAKPNGMLKLSIERDQPEKWRYPVMPSMKQYLIRLWGLDREKSKKVLTNNELELAPESDNGTHTDTPS